MVTRQQYIEYLLNTPVNYTCSNLAEHLEGVSHDAVSDFLQRGRVTANGLWALVRSLLNNVEEAVLIVEDSVQNKQYSQQIGLVQRQYRGAEHGLVFLITGPAVTAAFLQAKSCAPRPMQLDIPR